MCPRHRTQSALDILLWVNIIGPVLGQPTIFEFGV